MGAKLAKATVLTYLDAHCECYPHWLPPLLSRIAENERIVPCPTVVPIDNVHIGHEDLSAHPEKFAVGTFDWDLMFRWMRIPERITKTRKRDSDPIP